MNVSEPGGMNVSESSDPTARRGGDPAHSVIVAEHRHLASLFGELRAALDQGHGGQTAQAAVERLQEGMEAHFQREESLYYPTIWTLRPDLKGPLTGLVETHPQFRERMGACAEALATARQAEANRSLEELADLFSDHERAEELLLQSLDVELTGTA
jgi:hemerythrin